MHARRASSARRGWRDASRSSSASAAGVVAAPQRALEQRLTVRDRARAARSRQLLGERARRRAARERRCGRRAPPGSGEALGRSRATLRRCSDFQPSSPVHAPSVFQTAGTSGNAPSASRSGCTASARLPAFGLDQVQRRARAARARDPSRPRASCSMRAPVAWPPCARSMRVAARPTPPGSARLGPVACSTARERLDSTLRRRPDPRMWASCAAMKRRDVVRVAATHALGPMKLHQVVGIGEQLGRARARTARSHRCWRRRRSGVPSARKARSSVRASRKPREHAVTAGREPQRARRTAARLPTFADRGRAPGDRRPTARARPARPGSRSARLGQRPGTTRRRRRLRQGLFGAAPRSPAPVSSTAAATPLPGRRASAAARARGSSGGKWPVQVHAAPACRRAPPAAPPSRSPGAPTRVVGARLLLRRVVSSSHHCTSCARARQPMPSGFSINASMRGRTSAHSFRRVRRQRRRLRRGKPGDQARLRTSSPRGARSSARR